MEGKRVITQSFSETQKLGFDFARNIKDGDVICLHGDLGSGKTTFVQGLAKGLGIEQKIISPTFIIMRTYELKKKKNNYFYHVDLYRIESENDVEGLGLLDLMQDPSAIVVIEWPEKITNLLTEKRKDIFFNYIDDKKREIIFE
jgi:tRNA threonylcarbamoyladenosine biosynthesis protein TsaE